MNGADHDILGNSVLYARLCLMTEVLGKFVSSAPRAIDLARLEKETGRPAKELAKLCALLCRERLLRPHDDQPGSWMLACEPSAVTLEDAFRCALAVQVTRTARQKAKSGVVRPEVSLLVMQAAMGLNQSVFQHLRQFSLDRLRVSASGMISSQRSMPLDAGWPPPQLSYS